MRKLSPHARIVAALQDQIASGELRPGQRVPSTRQIVSEWGVAMATAAKALAVLREQGWVRALPGTGTIVLDRPQHCPPVATTPGHAPLSRDKLVRAAIELADTDGRAALSMRRLAVWLDVGVMSLYRYVPDKEELLRLMADAAFGEEELPEPGPAGWRAKLELSARLQWRAYRRHPWLVTIMHNSLIRPPAVVSGIRLVDWELRALRGLGLDRRAALHTILALDGYVGGVAASHTLEIESEQDTGISGAQRVAGDRTIHRQLFGFGWFPDLEASVPPGATTLTDLDELFEFGLHQHLDGIAATLDSS